MMKHHWFLSIVVVALLGLCSFNAVAQENQANLVAFVAADAPINVRNRPNGAVISSLPPNMSVAVLDKSKDGTWLSIALPDGRAGWISASLVRVMESAVPADLVPITPENADQLQEFTQLAATLAIGFAFSPDTRLLATYSWDTVINIYDVRTKILITTLTKHTKGLSKVAFSPDGSEMASASGDGSVKIWNTQTWGMRTEFRGHADSVMTMAYSPDGADIASVDRDGVMIIWDVKTGERLHVIDAKTNPVNDVVFSPDGSKIATAGSYQNGMLRLWDAATGEQIWQKYAGGNLRIAFSSDGKTLFVGTGGALQLLEINVETKDTTFMTSSAGGSPASLDINSAGTLIAAGTFSGLFTVTGVESQKVLFLNNSPEDVVYPGDEVAFSPDGRLLVSTDSNKAVYLWGVHGGE
jgi:WD40 repeat protein